MSINRPASPRPRLLFGLVAALLLAVAGCAGEKAHREGIELLDMGRVEDGLAKLEDATTEAPDNKEFRATLIRKREQYVNRMLLVADNERAIGRPDEAEVLYERVLVLDRENARAKAGMEAVAMDRRHAVALAQAQEMFKKGDLDGAEAKLQVLLLENPRNSDASALQRQVNDSRTKSALDSPALQSRFKKPVTLQFRDANLKMVFEALSRTSGINILLDKDVRPDLKTTIFVKDVSVEDTIDLILMQNQLEKKVLSENTIFVYPNTPAKIKEYQDLKIRTFHFVNADAKQMLTMFKTVLKTRDLFLDEKTNSVVMRDTPDAIRLAEKLVAAQDVTEPEVIMEVAVLEITRSRLQELGFKWPDTVGFSVTGNQQTVTPNTVTSGGAVVQGAPTMFTQPLTLETLRHGPSAASVTVTPTLNWTLNLKGEDTDANILASPRIRAKNKEKAKIMVGDRVPVITNTVTPVATGTPVVTGNVQYLDVGLKLEVEPSVHPDSDVAIKVNLEVSSLVKEVTSSSGTLAYQIGTRNASTLLRLKDGETQVLAGLISDSDREAAQKMPGMGDLPVLGRLFSSHRTTRDKTEIILSITPHIIRNIPPPDAATAEFWSGTDGSLRSKPVTLQSAGQVTVGTPRPTTQPRPVTSPPAATPARPAGQPQVTPPAPPAVQPQAAPPGAPAGAPTPPLKPGAGGAQPVSLNWQAPPQAKVGEQFQVAVNAQSSQEITSFPVRIGFDPGALKVVDVSEGNYFRQANLSLFTKDVDTTAGQLSINLTAGGGAGAKGAGTLAVVVFEATNASPKAQVAVLSTTPSGPDGKTLPATSPAPHVITLTP